MSNRSSAVLRIADSVSSRNFQEKVGAEGLLQLRRMAEQRAKEERDKFATKLSESMDEGRVEAALQTLADSSQVDGRRLEAAKAYASATGAHGNQTQVEQRAAEEFGRAQKSMH
jgi:hypothetical protein